ncbi:MAG: cytochrome c biogenesis CcdA family protein [bacterium]|jgi:cytochrome c-type biogenesis protein
MWEEYLTAWMKQALVRESGAIFLLTFAAGVITSLSPCLLAVLPAIVGYIGGYGTTRQRGLLLSTAFVFGTAVTFAGLGIAAALLGGLFGPVGRSWQYLLAAVSFGMGLNLLGFLPFHFPTLTRLPEIRRGAGGAFVLGLLFGLVASPCATPVLAVLIAFASSRGKAFFGGLLLFVYGLGHGIPLLLAGTCTAALPRLPALRRYSPYMTSVSGIVLLGLGIYFLLQATW